MIAYLKGKVTYKEPAYLLVETGGVGYELRVALPTFSAVEAGEERVFHVHHVFKAEKSGALTETLYGFLERAEKELYVTLTGVSGVGPSAGMAMLSSLSAEEIVSAIANGDVRTLQNVKGIGKKTAERLALELRDRFKKEGGPVAGLENKIQLSDVRKRTEALDALLMLGVARPSAEKSVDRLLKAHGDGLTVEELIRLALKTQ